jgi:hypothetical protein
MRASRTTMACFGEEHFGGAQLGDARRQRRLVALATQMAKHPGGTLPSKLNNPADLKALYRLMSGDSVTHAGVLQPHIDRTLDQMRAHEGVVLILHDTTELDYSGLFSLKDELGQIGNGGGRGYKCHNSLSVTAESREVLGLVNQILFNRPCVPKGEKKSSRRARATRESRLWKRGSEAIPAAPAGRVWVDVADRGADTTEFLDFEESQGKKYVVRSQHDRWVLPGHDGVTDRVKLHDWLGSLPEAGRRTVDVSARQRQPARMATVGVAWAPVRVLPPRQARGDERGTPLAVWGVRAWELDPPAQGEEPLEWILLTTVPVQTFEDACERLDWYGCRWIIEEYHKAMKTGCNIEQMEFRSQERLQPAIALVSVLAILLLTLRDTSRRPDADQRSARDFLPAVYVTVLSVWRFRTPDRDLTVREFYFALARLGGHQNRKHDHPPGWLVLWRGWTQLQAMVEGALAMEGIRCGQT